MGEQLLEREEELTQLARLVGGLAEGLPGCAVVAGEAGIGKTRLLAAVGSMGDEAALTVLRARGGELERDFAYGVARQLLRPGPGSALFEDLPQVTGADAAHLVYDRLYWQVADLCAQAPVLLVVDDGHWADVPTLRWLAYLVRRLEGLRAGLVLGWRTGEPGAPEPLRAEIARDALCLAPAPLSAEGARTLVGERLPGAGRPIADAVWEASGGNPFLLSEIVGAVAEREQLPTAEVLAAVGAPDAVTASVLTRLAALGDDAVAVARSAAVLEQDADIPRTAELSGRGAECVATAAAALSGAHILRPGTPLAFAHPLLRTAVYTDIDPALRALMHREAARALAAAGAGAKAAAQLMHVGGEGDPWSVDVLADAAAEALGRGAADVAAQLLRRALDEPPRDERRFEILVALGRAERIAGDVRGVERLREAVDLAGDPAGRTLAARELASALMFGGRGDEAVELLETVIASLPEDERELRLELEADLATFGVSVEGAAVRLAERLAAVAPTVGNGTVAERAILATYCLHRTMRHPVAGEVVPLAERAWADGRLVREAGAEQMPAYYLIAALRGVDALARAREIAEETVAAARAHGAITAVGTALANRGWVAWMQGDLRASEADGRDALNLAGLADIDLLRHFALAGLVLALTPLGELDEADRLLAEHGLADADPPPYVQSSLLLMARADLHFEQRRYAQARRDGELFYARCAERGGGALAAADRALALASLRLGEPDLARQPLERRLRIARRFGVPGDEAVALGSLGMVEGGEAGIALLEEAAQAARRSPRRLVEARVLLDLGALLRRAGRRADSRAPLSEALSLARRCDAALLAREAEEELRATGARPRAAVVSGADALTASERRVAEMVARGHTNREVAQALFVTLKTVESHMRSIFRKLDVTSRRDVARALGATDTAVLAALYAEAAPADLVALRAEAVRLGGAVVDDGNGGLLATFTSPTAARGCAEAAGGRGRIAVDVSECSLDGGTPAGPAIEAVREMVATAAEGEVVLGPAARVLTGG